MKKLLALSLFLLSSSLLFAQDKIVKHTGDTLRVKVIRVTDAVINYRFEGEDAEQQIGKLAVKKIVYSSGRNEDVSEKIVVTGKEDWEKVLIVTDKEMVVGLKKGEEIRGKTSGVAGFHTAGSADKKAMKKLMEAAAEAGVPIVLITSENDARSQSIGIGSAQGLKKGILYTYK
jgi:hypothetical protein